MTYILAATLLPPLLIFGLYHLATWFNLFGISNMVFWRRLALTSAIAHGFLATGLFLFSYYDFQTNRLLVSGGSSFEAFLFSRSEFWRLMVIFDTVPTLLTLGLFSAADRFGVPLSQPLLVTVFIVFLAGTAQWYWVGGDLAAALERIWEGLKTQDDDLDWL